MSMTIGEAQAVADLLHHLSGERHMPLEKLAATIDTLAQRASKTLQLTVLRSEAERLRIIVPLDTSARRGGLAAVLEEQS